MAWKDAQGNEIDTSGVDAKTLDVVGKIIGGAVASATAGMKTTITEAVTAAVSEHVQPLAAKVEEMGKAKPSGQEPKGDDSKRTDLEKAIEAALGSALAPVLESVNALKSEREQEKAGRTSRQIAEQFVGSKYPNLKGKAALISRLAAQGLKSEADAQRGFDAWKAEQAEFGIDVEKQLSASPEGEGAKDQGKGGDAEAEAAKSKKIEDIKRRGAA